MAITFDAQGNLVDTENNINFFNRGEELVYPKQGLEPLYPNFGAPMVNNTSLTPDVSSSNLISLIPEGGINTLQYPSNTMLDMYNQPQVTGTNSAGVFTVPDNDLEENAVTVDELGNLKQSGGISDLFKTLIGFAVPGSNFFLNKGRGALDGIKSLNQRLRNTDFAKSSSLADYFDARSYGGRDARDRAAQKTMREARAIQKQVDMRPSATQTNQDRGRGNRPGGANYSAPSKPSRASSYRDSSSFGKSFHG
jgi:hypothetical protein